MEPKIISKLFQNGPKMDPTPPGHPFGPRWPQDGSRWPQDAPKWPQDAPRWSKMRPRWPKVAPRWPKDGPKMAPRWPKDGPKMGGDMVWACRFFAKRSPAVIPLCGLNSLSRAPWLLGGPGTSTFCRHSYESPQKVFVKGCSMKSPLVQSGQGRPEESKSLKAGFKIRLMGL
jgi:hypothetical protein